MKYSSKYATLIHLFSAAKILFIYYLSLEPAWKKQSYIALLQVGPCLRIIIYCVFTLTLVFPYFWRLMLCLSVNFWSTPELLRLMIIDTLIGAINIKIWALHTLSSLLTSFTANRAIYLVIAEVAEQELNTFLRDFIVVERKTQSSSLKWFHISCSWRWFLCHAYLL